MHSYLIIGNGLIGRLTAWRLLLAGHRVAIVSSDNWKGRNSAGYVAAAMVSPATEAISSEPIVKTIGLRSYELWPQWLQDLDEPVYYQNEGTLVVAHQGDQAEMARFQTRASHILDDSDFNLLDQTELAEREPELADNFTRAILFAQESCVDNRHLFRLLAEFLGKQCQWAQCDEIVQINKASIEILCRNYLNCSASRFDAVIDCRGIGAKADLVDLRSVRGEVIRVFAPEVNFKHAIRLMHPRYPFYLAPRPGNEYILGATVIESDDMSPLSLRSGLELMSALYSLHKGFAEARIVEMAAHCRPGLPDNLPVIKRTGWGYHINGFYRHGYLFGPAVISDLLTILHGHKQDVMFGELYDV